MKPQLSEVNMFMNEESSGLLDEQFESVLEGVEPQILSAVIINLDNVAYNYHRIKNKMPNGGKVAAVVKGDSYGLGSVPISKRLYKEGCRYFFVATINEGIQIREALPTDDVKIFILSGIFANTEDLFIRSRLIPVLNNFAQTELWLNIAQRLRKKLEAVIHIDTGMSRNGFTDELELERLIQVRDQLNVLFIMSHLACADDISSKMNKKQLDRLNEARKRFGNLPVSFSSTNGIFLGDEYKFDIVRPGKALYGFVVRQDLIGEVRPVVDIFARIVQVNHLKSGDTIGYGSTFTAPHDMKTISIGMGYSDGFMRKFSGFGCGFLGGKKMPVVGRISMDYFTLDASEIDDKYLKLGEWVALTRYPDYTVEEWAHELNTIPHEITCRLGPRVKRVYVGRQ